MDCLRIIGGRQLHGSVRVGGSKNAALPILAASILAETPVRLRGIPSLLDVDTQLLVLKQLGVRADWLPGGELQLQTESLSCNRADHRLVSRMRASFCVLGPLLRDDERQLWRFREDVIWVLGLSICIFVLSNLWGPTYRYRMAT